MPTGPVGISSSQQKYAAQRKQAEAVTECLYERPLKQVGSTHGRAEEPQLDSSWGRAGREPRLREIWMFQEKYQVN